MSRSLKVAFFGSSLLSAYWNGAATYYRGIIRALHRLGHRVTFYEPDAFDRQSHRDIESPDWAEVVVYSADGTTELEQCLLAARSADVVVKASGVGVFDDYLEREILRLKSPERLVIFWDVDAPATLQRMHENPIDPFRDLVAEYDLILTYGGGPPVVEAYQAFRAAECIPIYNALDPETHHPAPADPRFSAELCFLGNRLPDREARVDEFFFCAASLLPDKRFLLGGNGWEDRVAATPNVRLLGHVYTHEHNSLNSTPLAILNVHRDSMVRMGYSPATRLFEAAAAAACQITDAWEGIELFLEPDEEILVARDGQEVAQLLSDLDPAAAREIGQRARRRMLAEHTYDHRARLLDQILRERCGCRSEV